MSNQQESSILRAIGILIANRRVMRELTQDQLGKAVAYSRETVANWEIGRQKIYLDQVAAIGNALRLEPLSLLPDPKTIDTNRLRSLDPNDLSPTEVDFYNAILGKKTV